MAKKIDLRSPKGQEKKRQVATYGTQTPLSSTAVERGSTRWLDGSRVDIEGVFNLIGTGNVSGRLNVGGTLDVTGTLNGSGVNNFDGTNNLSGDNNLTGPTEVSGSLDVTGPTNLDGVLTINGNTTITGLLSVTGPTNLDGVLTINGDTSVTGLLNVTGNTTLAGPVDITGDTSIKGLLAIEGNTTISGTLGIEGVTTLANDLNVTAGGRITAGDLMIEPASGGQVNFLNGSLSDGSFGAILTNLIKAEVFAPRIDLSASKVWVNGELEAIGTTRVESLYVGAGTELLNNRLKVGSLPNTTVATANVHVDSNGIFYRVT